MKVTRTFNKAQEIFKNKLIQSSNEESLDLQNKNIKTIALKYKKNSTIKLYKLYKYNKFFIARLKSLSKFGAFFTTKNIKIYFLNRILFFFKLLLKLTTLKSGRLRIINKLNKVIFYIKKLSSQKLLASQNKLKNTYLKTKKIFFIYFFEYQIFLKKKLLKDLIYLQNKTKSIYVNLKEFENITKLIFRIKLLFSKSQEKLQKLLVNANYSEDLLNKYIKRISIIIRLYSLPLLCLIKSFASYSAKNNTIIKGLPYLYHSKIPEFLKEQQTLDFYIFITYYALFCTTKNPLSLKKETLYHGIFCVTYLLINIALSFGEQLIITLVESLTILINIYFKSFILQRFRGIVLNPNAEFFETKTLFNSNNGYGIGGFSEYYLERLFENNSWLKNPLFYKSLFYRDAMTFLNSSVFSPIFLILILTLLYNCCYYIVYNKQPYIPGLTNLANRLTPNVQKD